MQASCQEKKIVISIIKTYEKYDFFSSFFFIFSLGVGKGWNGWTIQQNDLIVLCVIALLFNWFQHSDQTMPNIEGWYVAN